MSAVLGAAIAFPATLPPPLPNYTLGFHGARTAFETETGHVRRRRRTASEIRVFALEWVLSAAQYDVFRYWFETTLNDGTREFDIQLLDDSVDLVWYTCSVPSCTYQASPTAAMSWRVRMTVLSKAPSFAERLSGSSSLDGICEASFTGIGSLKDPGVNLLGRGIAEFTGSGALYDTMRGLATIEFTGTGRITSVLRAVGESAFVGTGVLFDPLEFTLEDDAAGTYFSEDNDELLESDP